jgi:c-di-GMP-binding flagellar brake protein YcgR
MAAEKVSEKLSMTQGYQLMAQLKGVQKLSLYFDAENYVETEIINANDFSVLLEIPKEQTLLFQIGKSFNFGFEYKGKNYTGSLMIDDTKIGLKAHLLKDLNIFQRREDFRVRPPAQNSHYINITQISNLPVNLKMNFIDLSQGGMKMALSPGAKLEPFKSEALVKGHLVCREELIEFSGVIKKPSLNSIGVQFKDLSAESKNEIWREVMRWSRSFSKYR